MCNKTIEERALRVFPGGVNSPIRSLKGLRKFPLIIKKAYKDILVDSRGKFYIDYCASWGALIHGHAHPKITSIVKEVIEEGSSYGLTSEKEIIFGEFILEKMAKKNHKIRFMTSGTEATMTAVRLARGITQRDIIIKFDGNYHGHSDVFLINSGSALAENSLSYSKGVPQESIRNTLSIPFNDTAVLLETVRKYNEQIAAIIFEPLPANMGIILPKDDFLNSLIVESKKIGALLIADEVYTGFRLGFKGAGEVYNFDADITIFGKIIGGGFPTAAIFAKEEIMNYLSPEGNVFQAGTLSGNPISMAAGLACLKLCSEIGFYEALEEKTKYLLKPIEVFVKKHNLPLNIVQQGSMFSFFFTEKKEVVNFYDVKECNHLQFKMFFNQLLDNGIYISPSQFEASFLSSVHSWDHLDKTSQEIISALKKIFDFS